jgi:hypothetical protein
MWSTLIRASQEFLAIFVCSALLPINQAHSGQQAEESVLKALILQRASEFIHWPQEESWPNRTPFTILCLDCSQDLHTALTQALEGLEVKGRPILVRAWTGAEEGQILLVGSTNQRSMEELLAWSTEHDVLLVGELGEFAQNGGHLCLTRSGDRITMTLNLKTMEEEGFSVSSRLVKVCRLVGRELP